MSKDLPLVYVLDASVAVTGAFVAARNIARTLKDTARVVLVLPEGSSIAAPDLADFARVEYIPMVNLSRDITAMARYVPAVFQGAWRLRKMMRRDGAKRLVLNDFYLMHAAALRLFGFTGHIVTWVRCNPVNFVGFLAQPMLLMTQLNSNRRVAVSLYIRSLLPSRFGAEIIYDCYDGPTRSLRIWGENEPKTFTYIGNYIAGKGQDVALAAFAIAAMADTTIQLAFYGGDMGLQKNRDYRSKLEAYAQQNGLAERVRFYDFATDTYTILEQSYAALNFSQDESFSMTVLEASGAGVPVIATASGGPQEILQHDVTGHLIPVGDVAAAAKYIIALAQNPTLASALGEAGAAHVGAHFSADTFRAQLHSVLRLPN